MNDYALCHPVRRRYLAVCLAVWLAPLLIGCGDGATTGPRSNKILIDSVHAHNFHHLGLREDVYDYHSSHGFHLGFAFLKDQGIEYDEMTEGTLTAEKLEPYQMLFMNLPSGELPPFTVAEINAVKAWVEGGGSVFFITDHSNCYYHAWKLKPLFNELGMKVTTETACEGGLHRLSSGKAWIDIANFKEHPITRGLKHIAFQSGGTVDDQFAVAVTTDEAWGDEWIVDPYGENTRPGYYGDFIQQPEERTGPLGVVAARTLGKGRIVVVADQNIFGDEFIKYADNYKLFLNSINWLMHGDDARADQWHAAFRDQRSPRFICHEHATRPAFGSDSPERFLNLFVYLQRKHWAFATEDLSIPAELIILPDDHALDEADLQWVTQHLKQGKPLLVLGAEAFAFSANQGLTGQLVDAFGIPLSRDTSSIAEVATFEGAGRVVVSLITESTYNESLSKPDDEPTDDHRLIFRRVDALIELCFKKDESEKANN